MRNKEIVQTKERIEMTDMHIRLHPNDKNTPAILAKQARRERNLEILQVKDILAWEDAELMEQREGK